jgi:hypothetical protein
VLAVALACYAVGGDATAAVPPQSAVGGLRAVAAMAPQRTAVTYATTYSNPLGSSWFEGESSGSYYSATSGKNYGGLAVDGYGNGPPWQNDGDIMGLCMADALNGWAVGNGGTVLRTRDGALSWISVTSVNLPAKDFYSVACFSANAALVVGAGGVIVRTSDGGVTWSAATVTSRNAALDLFCVAFSKTTPSNGVACGVNFQILASTDGGATWYDARPSSGRTTATLLSCAVSGSTTAIVGGTSSTVVVSTSFTLSLIHI